LILDYLNIRSW